jgi:hypothetical protein
MATNTAEKKKRRVYLKPLDPRLTAEDRLDADLRLLSRALRAWECKMRPSTHHHRPPTPDRCLPRDRFIASPVETGRDELGLPRLAETISKIPTCTSLGSAGC